MDFLLIKIVQRGQTDPMVSVILNQFDFLVDSCTRLDVGKYQLSVSADLLDKAKAGSSIIGNPLATKIKATVTDVNIVLIETFSTNDDPVDLGGEALLGVEIAEYT